MSKYCIIGHHGFIGSALAKAIGNFTTYPVEQTEYIFYMGGMVHPVFEKNPTYFRLREDAMMMALIAYCGNKKTKLIYCSSALVLEKNNPFSTYKKSIERLAGGVFSLGLRIFPVYGPGDHDTFITQAIKKIMKDESPEIWGDGTQARDFIYVDDVARIIFENKDKVGILEVGTGDPVSFNEIVEKVNKYFGKDVKPVYKPAPEGYSPGIKAFEKLQVNVSLEEGIKKICEAL